MTFVRQFAGRAHAATLGRHRHRSPSDRGGSDIFCGCGNSGLVILTACPSFTHSREIRTCNIVITHGVFRSLGFGCVYSTQRVKLVAAGDCWKK